MEQDVLGGAAQIVKKIFFQTSKKQAGGQMHQRVHNVSQDCFTSPFWLQFLMLPAMQLFLGL